MLSLSDIVFTNSLYLNQGVVDVFVGRRINRNSPQNLICIKIIKVMSVKDADKRYNECWYMSQLHHDNIVTLISMSYNGNGNRIDSLVLFMEFCANGDLETLIASRIENKQAWSLEELLDCLDQLIKGFVYLQIKGIAHRDVKPKNIFIENDYKTFKIGDLGSSRVATGKDFTVTGTDSYLSPKVRQGFIDDTYSPTRINHDLYKSDVYSLGITLLYMTTGQLDERLKYLNGLQGTINTAISAISNDYSMIKILLSHMLQCEEIDRPNFLELQELFNKIRHRELMIDCIACRARKSQEQFRGFEVERICEECIIDNNACAGSLMLRCNNCGDLKNQALMKGAESECFCNECISKLDLYPDSKL